MMALEMRRLRLPLTGTLLDWESFSGDPNDPLRVVGPEHVYRHFVEQTRSDTESDDRYYFELRLLSIDADAGEAEVTIMASTEYWIFYENQIGKLTPKEILSHFGEPDWKVPKTKRHPRLDLVFNR